MMRFSTLRRRLPAAGLCLALSATVLAPLPAVAAEAREYRIEAGRLDSALSRYASEAGLTLVIDGRLTEGKTTSGLDGRYDARGGLRALLAGSG
ncbi:MAG TPA: TonB-dependent receptor, partial [Alcanivorax sp.]|nr:TonB-dependent receptor [Alcanivorax sp.]